MGLFEKIARDIIKQFKDDTSDSKKDNNSYYSGSRQANNSNTGCSWGDIMPDEENQFSFDGEYYEYFEKIYNKEFPEYDIKYEKLTNRNATIFTFIKDNDPVLYVELLSSKSSSKKFRTECAQYGISYLRFYFDKDGWWNTRSYVINRTKFALGL